VFIDEIDAIGTKRFDSQTGADREVQRILLELLNQMDGFDQDYVSRPEKISCADIAAICQEAGMQAVRHNRYIILPKTSSRAGRTKPRRRTAISTSTATEQLGLSQQLVYRVPADGCGACCCNLLPSRPKKVVEPIEDRTFLTFP
ncbi:unnamed protein product, partial [Polarella glacialis]